LSSSWLAGNYAEAGWHGASYPAIVGQVVVNFSSGACSDLSANLQAAAFAVAIDLVQVEGQVKEC
jgi:hypothetical protein